MIPGDVISTRSIKHVGQGGSWFTFSAGKKRLFHFVFLGTSADNEDFDPEAALRALGWQLPDGAQVEGLVSTPISELVAPSQEGGEK